MLSFREPFRVGTKTYTELIPEPGWVAEGGGRAFRPPEKLLHCLWYDRRWRTDRLRTRDGRQIRVESPGLWNLSGEGPDFRNAVLRIGDALLRGDVEIHLLRGEWHTHGHVADPRYAGVVLHVALEDDRSPATRRSDGSDIPECILAPALAEPIDVLAREVDAENYPEASFAGTGLCCSLLAEHPEGADRLPDLLRAAGWARLIRKARRWNADVDRFGEPTAFLRAAARALGYRPNAAPFERVIEAIPAGAWSRWREAVPAEELAEALTAMLLHVARLDESPGARDGSDPETREWRRRSVEWIARLRAAATPSRLSSSTEWKRLGLRPVNFPERRLAGLAACIASWPDPAHPEPLRTARRLLAETRRTDRADPRLWPMLTADFLPSAAGYWARRAVAGGTRFSAPVRMIGPERARVMLLNAVIPAVLSEARQRDDAAAERHLRDLIDALPVSSPIGGIGRFVSHRLFGPQGDGSGVLNPPLARQGALLLFEEWCGRGHEGCADCPLAGALRTSGA